MLGPGLKKEKPLSSEFAFSLAAAFLSSVSALGISAWHLTSLSLRVRTQASAMANELPEERWSHAVHLETAV